MLDHLIEFFARTHLVVLHFPIALLIVAAVLELFRALNLKRTATHYTPGSTGTTLFAFAILACIYTVISGLVLGFGDSSKVDLHRILGIVTGVLVVLTLFPLLASRKDNPGNAPRLYLALLTISAAAVGFTGHLGGDITHGKGFLTRPLLATFNPQPDPQPIPNPTATLNPADFAISQASFDIYLDQIQPIFDANCIDCHGPDEAENDVRLDALKHVLDPDLDILVRGDPDASEIIYLIDLPAGDPDIMPPEDEGKPLNAVQINAIRDWIKSLAG